MRYTPRNRSQWRKWLEKNHNETAEVWLVFRKQHTGERNLSYSDGVEEALCFGWIDGVKRSIDENRYMHRFTARKSNSSWSKSNRDRVQKLLATGQMATAGMRAIERAKRNGQWNEAVSRRVEFEMPPELDAQLRRNRKAARNYEALAPSYQRQYIAWIATAKRAETRKRRLDEAVELLTRGEKLGMR